MPPPAAPPPSPPLPLLMALLGSTAKPSSAVTVSADRRTMMVFSGPYTATPHIAITVRWHPLFVGSCTGAASSNTLATGGAYFGGPLDASFATSVQLPSGAYALCLAEKTIFGRRLADLDDSDFQWYPHLSVVSVATDSSVRTPPISGTGSVASSVPNIGAAALSQGLDTGSSGWYWWIIIIIVAVFFLFFLLLWYHRRQRTTITGRETSAYKGEERTSMIRVSFISGRKSVFGRAKPPPPPGPTFHGAMSMSVDREVLPTVENDSGNDSLPGRV